MYRMYVTRSLFAAHYFIYLYSLVYDYYMTL